MNITTIRLMMGALCGCLLLGSCADKLDVTDPNKFTDEQIEDILKNGTDSEREMILGGMAANMAAQLCKRDSKMYGGFSNMNYDNEWAFAMMRDLQCGDIVYGDTRNTDGWGRYYRNDPSLMYWESNQIESCYGYWVGPSLVINEANKVLMYLTDEIVGESALLKRYKAQCLTVRGFGYMELMERFTKAYLHGGKEGHGMPIYTKYAYNDPVAPASAEETWNFIKNDLEEAERLFGESGYGVDGYTIGNTQTEVYDIDMGIARYMIARAALQTGDYTTCIEACRDILDHYGWNFIKEEHYGAANSRVKAICEKTDDVRADDNAFFSVAVNPECLFGWTTDTNQYPWFYMDPFNSSNGGYGEDYMQIDQALYDRFADDDFRKERFTTEKHEFPYFEIVSNDTVWYPKVIPAYTSLKWAASIASDQSVRTHDKTNSDVILFRTSEVLLMMSEAQAVSGDEAGAKSTLDRLLAARTKEGATSLTCDNYPSMRGLSALEMVKLQWRMEMWAENGLNFFNHKRWNEAPVYEGANHWSDRTSVTIEHMTWDIPDKETQANPNW